MKRSLSGSTYILLTAKSSIDIYTLPKLSNTQRENGCAGSAIDTKAFLPEEFVLFFIFLNFLTSWWMKMHLKLTLYHNLAIAKIFFTNETKTEAQSAKIKVTPDKTVSS